MTEISLSTPLMSGPTGSTDTAIAYAKANGADRLSDVRDYIAAIYRLAPTVGLDPGILVAQSDEETDHWRSDWWVDTLNPAGIGIMGGGQLDNMVYQTGEEAAKAQIVHMLGYVRGSVPVIAEPWIKYDPRWDELMRSGMAGSVSIIDDLGGGVWAVDPKYAEKIVAHYNVIFRSDQNGGPSVPSIPTKHSVSRPTIYNLATDYAMFGLTKGQADEIIASCFRNRNGGDPRVIVYHIQAGSTRGSLGHWASPAIDASSTVMIQKDGSILLIVPEQHGPWTNGDVKQPTAQAGEVLSLGGNPNNWSLTIELEGQPGDPLSEPVKNALIWITEDWIMKYPKILNFEWCLLRHGFINSVDRAFCGIYMDPVVAAVNDWLGDAGTVPPEPPVEPPAPLYPEGMTFELARELYGSVKVSWASKPFVFDPTRSECQYWIARGKLSMTGERYDTGTWPQLEQVKRRGTSKNVHVFQWSNGDVFEKPIRKDA